MHPTLLVGAADWDAARMPREEFVARIAAMWEVCEQTPVAPVGLALEETLPGEADDVLASRSVYSLRVGILDRSETAIVSAMVAITADGAEVMWMQP